MDTDQIRDLLRQACSNAGSASAWAKAHDVSIQYAADVVAGRREPGAKILDALGFERVVTYRKIKGEKR